MYRTKLYKLLENTLNYCYSDGSNNEKYIQSRDKFLNYLVEELKKPEKSENLCKRLFKCLNRFEIIGEGEGKPLSKRFIEVAEQNRSYSTFKYNEKTDKDFKYFYKNAVEKLDKDALKKELQVIFDERSKVFDIYSYCRRLATSVDIYDSTELYKKIRIYITLAKISCHEGKVFIDVAKAEDNKHYVCYIKKLYNILTHFKLTAEATVVQGLFYKYRTKQKKDTDLFLFAQMNLTAFNDEFVLGELGEKRFLEASKEAYDKLIKENGKESMESKEVDLELLDKVLKAAFIAIRKQRNEENVGTYTIVLNNSKLGLERWIYNVFKNIQDKLCSIQLIL